VTVSVGGSHALPGGIFVFATFPATRGASRAVLAYREGAEAALALAKKLPPAETGPDVWPMLRLAAEGESHAMAPQAHVGCRRDALIIREACWLASKDHFFPPNLRAALRHRAIELTIVLGESVVDVVAEADRR